MGIGIGIIIGGAILLVVIIFAGVFVGIYNALVRLKNDIKKSWANIDVLLKQRSDELPKLIASVKGYMKHEKGLLTDLTKARTAFLSAKTMSAKAQADGTISGVLKSLFAVAENYPNLKANENFVHLQTRISGLENELADRREFYNESVNNYNIKIQSFPDMIFANMLGYKEEPMFKVDEADRKDVKVEF
ncbi:LemA family protein [Candidatus Woesearchaeota archaeon]|nr:LemA family protein [Candidatus Woesearchaeota archaeon]